MARECLATRNSVGIMDASTLGKIDARGPDVVEFLARWTLFLRAPLGKNGDEIAVLLSRLYRAYGVGSRRR